MRRIALEVAREPMFLLLIVAGLVYLMLGSPSDALMLLAFVLLAMSMTIYQERKTERVLETLRELSSPRALVIRAGRHVRIPGREVVVDDLLVLEEGDRVPADGVLLDAHDLMIDESLLTGESVALPKLVEDGANGRVFSGTMVVQGGGLARITATGAASEIGKIGKALQSLESGKSPLQREIGTLVRNFSFVGVALSVLVLILYGYTRGDWYNGLLVGISLSMSVLPEEFTVVLSIFMALGAWRMSKSRVLTRRTPVIETLGSATVLCVDKTGTLTENRMAVHTVLAENVRWRPDIATEPPREVAELLDFARLASEVAPFDPMDKAFHNCISEHLPALRNSRQGWTLEHEYPLTSEILAMTHGWRSPDGSQRLVATKGAPESVARLCGFDAQRTLHIMQQVDELAKSGMRVLGVARAVHEDNAWPPTSDAFRFEWLGLVGLADPVRPGVPHAVQECRHAGIKVIMITGDHAVTAQAIARDAGLRDERVVTGSELDTFDDAALRAAVAEVRVFARIRPEQKLRLVSALKDSGEIVAMTGDGVNDAPALKAAHIGISMGERGTDVAREASSLVLLNDDFDSIVQAIRLGRRIYDNLRKALTYIVAAHLPIAGMTMLPLLFGTPMAFAPVHIVFLEMIINPACSVVFEMERAEGDVMKRKPRAVTERLFGARNVVVALLQGFGLLGACAAVFFFGLRSGASADEARAAAFASVVLGNLLLIVVSRSASGGALRSLRIPNPAQWWVVAGAGAGLALVLYLPALHRLFHFAPLRSDGTITGIIALLAALVWFELVKRFSQGTRSAILT